MVTKDAHPFLAPRVRKYLEQKLHLDESSRMSGSGTGSMRAAAQSKTCWRMTTHRTLLLRRSTICLVAHLTSAKMLVIHPLRQAAHERRRHFT
jgi:hypothetical protein